MRFEEPRLQGLCAAIARLRVGILGDFALDFYYDLQKESGEFSLETGHEVHWCRSPRTALGGAGNVAQNLRALGVAKVRAFGIVGDDVFGRELIHTLGRCGADGAGMLVQEQAWDTAVFTKPHLDGQEQSRQDFGSRNRPDPEIRHRLAGALSAALPELDALILNRQMIAPLMDEEMIGAINKLLVGKAPLITADFREGGQMLRGAILKMNAGEIARLLGVPEFDARDDEVCRQRLRETCQRTGAPVLMTRGECGLIFARGDHWVEQPGVLIGGSVDPVGAGDACIAAFSAALAAGASSLEALAFANLAAAVTVKKLRQTGTAQPQEIIELNREANFLYRPMLAEDPRLARRADENDVERVSGVEVRPKIRCAILDHDGTLSTLREGWEPVMLGFMVESILGERLHGVERKEVERVEREAREFIDATVGSQTILQMQGLANMVRQAGYVPCERIGTPGHYKQGYLERLMAKVREHRRLLQNGERQPEDFIIRGSHEFLRALRERGLQLFLASGTDEEDVVQETAALGFSPYFDGGIHGSHGNEIGDAKRRVIQRLLEQQRGDELIVIGDGPVELQEGRRAGALCLGVASDEVRRYGWNLQKRRRLIRAGADLLVADYTNLRGILSAIFAVP